MVFDFWTIKLNFNDNDFEVLDQKLLPHIEKYVKLSNKEDVFRVIKDMKVRGAPLIGIVALIGLYLDILFCINNKNNVDIDYIEDIMNYLSNARPTAINVFNYFNQLKQILVSNISNNYLETVKEFIIKIIMDEKERNDKISKNGVILLRDIFKDKVKLNILTHCNTGSLATIGLGTALGIIKLASKFFDVHVYVDETRPYLQGSRLTALELEREKINFSIIPDSAAAFLMSNNKVDIVIVGADRVALNGDVANKIGTLNLAILCSHFSIPFVVALPESSIDKKLQSLKSFQVENRDSKELLSINFDDKDYYITKSYYSVYNPSFDITPCKYVSYIVTDFGIKGLNEFKKD